jgi:glycosyltransferase involved in cell wall biosynthesis
MSTRPGGPLIGPSSRDAGQCVREFAEMLAGVWRTERPDVVHAHAWLYGLSALLAARRYPGLPVVQTFHGIHLARSGPGPDGSANWPGSASGGGRAERAIGGRFAAVIAQSRMEQSDLLRVGIARGRISVIPYGVDVRRMSPDGPELARSRKYRLAVFDPLTVPYGVDDVVAALPALPDTELVVAGGPPAAELAHDGDARRIRALADRLGVADRVSLVGGVAPARVPRLLRGSDAMLSVPRAQASGKAALDAMACGVPVVCTDVGGLADAVVDGVTGLHVPARRPDLLARTTRALLLDGCRRCGLAMAGRDRILARYGWRRVATETQLLYERLCDPCEAGVPSHATRVARTPRRAG